MKFQLCPMKNIIKSYKKYMDTVRCLQELKIVINTIIVIYTQSSPKKMSSRIFTIRYYCKTYILIFPKIFVF